MQLNAQADDNAPPDNSNIVYIRGMVEVTVACEHVVNVSSAEDHSAECLRLQPYCGLHSLKLRPQNQPPAYTLNGTIYFSTSAGLSTHQSLYVLDVHALIMPNRAERLLPCRNGA
jgi:hypothetical protein